MHQVLRNPSVRSVTCNAQLPDLHHNVKWWISGLSQDMAGDDSSQRGSQDGILPTPSPPTRGRPRPRRDAGDNVNIQFQCEYSMIPSYWFNKLSLPISFHRLCERSTLQFFRCIFPRDGPVRSQYLDLESEAVTTLQKIQWECRPGGFWTHPQGCHLGIF